MPHQIGGKNCRALQHDDEAQRPAAVVGVDPAGKRGGAGADAPLGDQQLEPLGHRAS